MEFARFILAGKDKKTLSVVKNSLLADGHIFTGYTTELGSILRHIRNQKPELLFVDVGSNFTELLPAIEVIDEELLACCILVLESRNDRIFDFLAKTRVITYMSKPVFEEVISQIADISLANYKRIIDYENKVKKLNDTLESRKLVEKAKWLLVEQRNISEAEAYGIIKKKSRDNRMTMKEIADAIILTRG